MSLIVIAYCAPSPYYTRSFVRTPTSQVEQYLIVPDKNDPYKVPMGQVHDFNEFKFPKRQIFYYNPTSQSSSLHEMSEDSPMWQKVMETMKEKSDEMPMDKMDMMQPTDAALESEMMANVDAMSSKISQRETRLMTEAIMKDNRNVDMIDKPIIVADEVNAKMTQDDAMREELMSIITSDTMTDDMKQKAADLLEATEPQYDQKLMAELLEEKTINDDQLKLIEMMQNFKLVQVAAPSDMELNQREAKAMDMMNSDEKAIETTSDSNAETAEEIDIKSSPLNLMEMIKIAESTTQKIEIAAIEDSEMKNLPLRVLDENQEEKAETQESAKPKSIDEIMQQILKINEASLNVLEMMKLIEQTTTAAPAIKEEVEKITESIRADSQDESKCNKTEPAMSSQVMSRIIELLSNLEGTTTTIRADTDDITSPEVMSLNEEIDETSREPKMMELELVKSDETQGENMELKVVEVTTDSNNAMPENIEITSTEKITITELRTTSSTTSEAIVIKSESTTETPIRTMPDISATNDESTAGMAEISSRDNGNENDSSSEQESMEQEVNARQGRLNDSPTLFLHNNRFYVVSGAPEFYANFNAYQRSRTPIFSLQELQPIRPMQKNVRVQKVEPFRIYVGDENENARNDDESKSEIEPLKLDDNEKDSQARDIEMQSMKSTVVEVKKQEQASAGEGQIKDNLLRAYVKLCNEIKNSFLLHSRP